jgi:dyslexia susceptibility 1 candidate gene 1 protein
VTFTPLETPHLPAREAREEGLRLQRRGGAGAAAGVEDSAELADRQPAFLKDKGDALYKQVGGPLAMAWLRARALGGVAQLRGARGLYRRAEPKAGMLLAVLRGSRLWGVRTTTPPPSLFGGRVAGLRSRP